MTDRARPARSNEHAAVCAGLWARRSEIEQATRRKIYAVPTLNHIGDTRYSSGLQLAIDASLDYAIASAGVGAGEIAPPPASLLAQARLAARCRIGLATVVRGCLAAHAVLEGFLIDTVEGTHTTGHLLAEILTRHARLFDQLVAIVSDEYAAAADESPASTERRRAAQVLRLLAGDEVDTAWFNYDLEGNHLAAIGQGSGATKAVRRLAQMLDFRHLLIEHSDETVWLWLGDGQPIDISRVLRFAEKGWPSSLVLAFGESALGPEGWRLSHRQARAALPMAVRSGTTVVRYVDVALLASVISDDLLAASLKELYLAPLEKERDQGELLRKTLRTYFACDRNVSATAASLGVNRRTVASRLQVAKAKLNRSPNADLAPIEIALQLDQHIKALSGTS